MPALSLATIGVALTTLLFGAAAFYLTDFTWLESFLLGAAVASTDAAAVFFLLRVGNIHLRDRVRSTLEIESGTNDPIAIFLTITLVEVIAAGADPEAEVLIVDLVVGFFVHMGIGAVVGLLGGLAIVRLVERLDLDHGLLPIFVLTLSLLVFAAAGAIGGSGFLAVYLAGLVAGNSDIRARRQPEALPGRHVVAGADHHVPGARPVRHAVAIPGDPAGLGGARPVPHLRRAAGGGLALPRCRSASRAPETAFVSWVGLRGAVSILLAITPLLGGLENGRDIFNAAFIIVLVSLVVQGWTVGPLARRLGLIVPAPHRPAGEGRARTARLGASRTARLYVVAGSPVASRRAHPALGAALAGGARRPLDEIPGCGPAGGRRPRLHLRAPTAIRGCSTGCSPAAAAVSPDDADFFGAFAARSGPSGHRAGSQLRSGPERCGEEAHHRPADAAAARRTRRICRPADARRRSSSSCATSTRTGRSCRSGFPSSRRRRRCGFRPSSAPAKWPTAFARCFSACGGGRSAGRRKRLPPTDA